MFPLAPTAFVHEVESGRRWNAEELEAESTRRAGLLTQHITPERRNVIITHGNSLDFFADLFAIWKAGGAAVCANPGLTKTELENIVEFTDAAVILVASIDTEPRFRGVPMICARSVSIDITTSPIPSLLDDEALILFTSGTTGDPKGVVHSHRNLLARVALNVAHLGKPTLSRSLCVLPTHFGHGLIGNCLTPLAAGCGLFLEPNAGMATAARLRETIEDHQISFMSSVPSFWKMALRLAKSPQTETIRRVSIGSAPLSAELWDAVRDWSCGADVANMYGITETANWVGGASTSEFKAEDGLLGRLWGGAAAVRLKDGTIVSKGEGELLLKVPSVMTRYYKRPDLTEAVLHNGWYATGDLGTICDQGVMRLTGRERYVIIQGGINIFPEELDMLFERHDAVAEACAFGIPDPIAGQAVALAVSLYEDADVTGEELKHWARQRLRPEAVPRVIHMLADIPKTDRGKLNRDLVALACEKEAR